ncbi:MAG: DJ-1/PfpI family protein [Actinomycetota bacterium]|nr:DJ-1/PfpI family protein [Candidatus Dormibacteraeota bacterium]MDQ6949773.1 DJ-1/PfpI family protein [Actinomycetota bacterium]
MLLARAGIVGNRRASTDHKAVEDLAAAGAEMVHECVVDEAVLTSPACCPRTRPNSLGRSARRSISPRRVAAAPQSTMPAGGSTR